jgi:hypothetical protein
MTGGVQKAHTLKALKSVIRVTQQCNVEWISSLYHFPQPFLFWSVLSTEGKQNASASAVMEMETAG